MSLVADLLEQRSETLLERWLQLIQHGIVPEGRTEPELRDHVPMLLRELVRALRLHDAPEHSLAAEAHGRQRHRIGFDVRAVVREYGVLRDVVFGLLEETQSSVSVLEARVITDFVSNAIAESVLEHNEERERELTVFKALVEGARDEAKKAREELHALFMQAPVGICIMEGPEHVYTFANPAYRAIVGGRDVVGKPLFEAVPEIRGQGFADLLDRVIESGEPVFGDAQPASLLRDGAQHTAWFNFAFSPTRDAEGRVRGVMQCAFDVTEQVLAHRHTESLLVERERAREALKRQQEFEQQLIGIVSHDLRTPLNVILLASSRLTRGEELGDAATKNVLRIQNAAQRANGMVADLLDFTKARLGGGISIEPRDVDLHELVSKVLEEIEISFPNRQIELTEEGASAGTWDPDRFAQVVQNLVTNALDYSPPDSPVRIAIRADAEHVVLTVHNFGAPIPDDKRAALFEPFQRGTMRGDRGARSVGLGLYIVKQVVDAHHGSVEVHSSAPDGTTFTVRLPRFVRA